MANVKHFGAVGDGQTDDTAAISHAIQQGDGLLEFPRGDYVISAPLFVPLDLFGRFSATGMGGQAKILMTGPGPAFHLVGTHRRTADPEGFAAGVWRAERLPTLSALEIEGAHPEADGVRLEGVMQPTLHRLLIRRCRHGVHLADRARNVLISDCHVYHNSGVGLFFDHVNLHQTNVHGCHISYCKQGGIQIVGSEIRNLQICSNDIEYNYDLNAKSSADVLLDCRHGTIREGTIVGNTIQARQSPNGANVRLMGMTSTAVGLFAITGNLLGSQDAVLHLQSCRGVVVAANCIYSGYTYAILAEDAEHLVISGNSIDHNPEYRGKSTDRIVFRKCRGVSVSGVIQQHTLEPQEQPPASMEIQDCENVNVIGCQVLNARQRGILVERCRTVRVADCTIRGRPGDATYRLALDIGPGCAQVMIAHNFLGKGLNGAVRRPEGVGSFSGNEEIV